MRRLLPLLIAVPLTIFAASCGGQAEVGSEAAKFAPADAAVFAVINTDFESEQYDTARTLLNKFPDGDRATAFFLDELANQGIDFDEDVRPALGPEVGVVVFDVSADTASVVGFTQPRDRQKLTELLEQAEDQPLVTREIEGWTVFAEEEAMLDAFEQRRKGGSIADSDDFQNTMSTVSQDGIASAYVDGSALTEAVKEDPETPAAFLDNCLPGGIPSLAFALKAESGGVRIDEAARSGGDDQGVMDFSDPYEAQLPEVVPGGALVYFSFRDLEKAFSAFRDCFAASAPEFDQGLAQVEAAIGVSIEEDLLPLFANEGAFYVRKGSPFPEVTLVLEVDDERKAEQVVDDLLAGLRGFTPELGSPQQTEIAGVQAKQVAVSPPFSLFYAAFDGRLVLTSTREGIAELKSDEDRLADDEFFKQAADDSGMPDETGGYLLLNLEAGIPYVLDFASAAGAEGDIPGEVRRNVEPLKHLTFYSTEDGDVFRATAFLAVE